MSVPLRKCSSILIHTNLKQININSENPSKKTSLSEDPMSASTGPKHKGSVTSLDSEVGMHQELLARINSPQLLLLENDHVNHETHQNIAELNFFYGIGEFSCFDPC